VNGYIALYYLYLGQRCAEALKALTDGFGDDENATDKRFVEDLVEVSELGRMENTTIFIEVADWKRLLSFIPDVQPRMPVKPGDKMMPKPLQDEIDNIERLKVKIAAATKGNLRKDLKLVESEVTDGPAEAS
jgi:hypothetical protein